MNRRTFIQNSGAALLGAVLTSPRCPPQTTIEYYYAGLPFYGTDDRMRVLRELEDIYFEAMLRASLEKRVPYESVSLFYVPVQKHDNGIYGTIGFSIPMGPYNKYAPEIDISRSWRTQVTALVKTWNAVPERDRVNAG